jgi:hypothetical protein
LSPAPSRQVRRALERAAARKVHAERRAAFRATLDAAGGRHCRPREIPQRVRARVRDIHETRTGSSARRALGALPRHWRAKVEHVARHPGRQRVLGADLSHPWARLVVACAWFLYASRRRSRRHGFGHVVDGYTQAMVCALFRNAEGHAYSRSRVYASSYRKGSDELGPMPALKRCQLVYYAAPPPALANPRFCGPPKRITRADGSTETRCFPFAVYWLDTEPPS